jgi:hypothetical protein
MPTMIERHRHEGVPASTERVPVEDLGEPVDQLVLAIVFIAILVADYGLEHLPLSSITGSSPIKMPRPCCAIVAGEFGRMPSQRWIGIAALPAIRRFDTDGLGLRANRLRERQA